MLPNIWAFSPVSRIFSCLMEYLLMGIVRCVSISKLAFSVRLLPTGIIFTDILRFSNMLVLV